jgi:hypothetical protein
LYTLQQLDLAAGAVTSHDGYRRRHAAIEQERKVKNIAFSITSIGSIYCKELPEHSSSNNGVHTGFIRFKQEKSSIYNLKRGGFLHFVRCQSSYYNT